VICHRQCALINVNVRARKLKDRGARLGIRKVKTFYNKSASGEGARAGIEIGEDSDRIESGIVNR
jgi:hypothetical protein